MQRIFKSAISMLKWIFSVAAKLCRNSSSCFFTVKWFHFGKTFQFIFRPNHGCSSIVYIQLHHFLTSYFTGIANFKIAAIALWPVGRRVVSVETAQAAREANARRRFQ